MLSDTTNDQTIQLSEIGDIQITEIARKGRILQDGFEFTGQNLSQEVSGIALEEDGFILLDASRKEGQGINTTVFDAGSSILLENITGKQEKIILEESWCNSRRGLFNSIYCRLDTIRRFTRRWY